MEVHSPAVITWWLALTTFGLFNIYLWFRARARLDKTLRGYRRWQVIFSGIYAFVCAFRSFLPRADVQRIVLFDTWISSVAVGRTVATIAELCFIAQLALYLHEIAQGARWAVWISRLVVPLIVVAETFSWYAVLTTNFIGNACEQSLWTLSGALLVIGAISLLPRVKAQGDTRTLTYLKRLIALGTIFVFFMCTVDVPMYLTRWNEDNLNSRAYLTLAQGWEDCAHRWVVTWQWQDWRDEMAWMALYFSLAVWSSISLIHAPRAPTQKPSRQ